MRYLSVCSGIEAASVAWSPLGFAPAAFAEVDRFPSAVLEHHYPDVPNWGDMTRFKDWPDATIDVLVGGTPCQSFSVAGLRAGLGDPRGNLALTYLAIADRYRPSWLVWENVPGVLSSASHAAPDPCPPPPPLDLGCDGAEVDTEDDYRAEELHAFQCFLAGLSELGYGFAYRELDAQYFGLAQRRRRVFVVGHLGDWRRAAAVLFERESLSGHPAPRRETREGTTRGARARAAVSSGRGWWEDSDVGATIRSQDSVTKADTLIASTGAVSHCLNAGGMGRIDYETETLIAHSLRADGFDASEDGTGRGTPIVPIAYSIGSHAGAADGETVNRSHATGGPSGMGIQENISHSLRGGRTQAVAFRTNQTGAQGPIHSDDITDTLAQDHPPAVAFDARQSDVLQYGDKSGPLDTDGHTKAYDLQAFTDLEIQAALSVLLSVNAPLFDWLTALLVAGQPSASPAPKETT